MQPQTSRHFNYYGTRPHKGGLSTYTSSTSGIALEEMKEDASTTHDRDSQDRHFEAEDSDMDTTSLAFDAFVETKRSKGKSHHIEKKFLKFCRLLMYILTFLLVVTCGVFNKLSVLKIINDYSQNSGKEQLTNAIYLLVLICIYPTLTLLSSLFKVVFGKVRPLSKGIIIIVVIINILNTVGILLLIYTVLPHLTAVSSLYVMSFLPIIPSMLRFVRSMCCAQGKFQKRLLKGVFYLIIFCTQVGCFIWLYFTDVLDLPSSSSVIYLAPTAVILISLSWWENFTDFKMPKILRHPEAGLSLKDELKKGRDKMTVFTSLSRLLTVGICVLLVTYNMVPDSINDSLFKGGTLLQTTQTSVSVNSIDHSNNTDTSNSTIRTNRTCVSHTSQNTTSGNNSTYLCIEESLGLEREKNNNLEETKSFFENIYNFMRAHYIVLLTVATTFTVTYCATLACKLRMQRFSFSLATLLISPMTLLYLCLRCAQQLPAEFLVFETTNMCPSWDIVSPGQIILFILVWMSTCLLTHYIWLPKAERMAKIDSMFVSPLKDCILLDYNLILRRKNDNKNTTESSDKSQRIIPKLYVCATMWHETRKEMFQLLKSLLRLDRHCALSQEAEKIDQHNSSDPDKFEPEIHVIFDDAFELDPQTKQEKPNSYVSEFLECLDEAAVAILGSEVKSEWTDVPVVSVMPYGGRITHVLPGKTTMVVHLKNKNKIRHRKRWSQIMYLYYLLGFKSFAYKERSTVLPPQKKDTNEEDDHKVSFVNRLPETDKVKLQNTFILTLDGDVDFKPPSVLRLLDRMKKNVQVGAVCGRIHPIGSGPMIWYQKFEYAVGHWLQKAAEHVLGCVLCCPGCFSLFRASALMDNNVIKTYTKKPKEALHYIQFEQGEDRWLCTLLLQQGYKIDYCAGADAKTFAPESFNDFYVQRRRWSPSTNANIIDLLASWRHTVSQNADISRLFMVYQALMVATSILAPATVTMLIADSYRAVLHISGWSAYLLSLAPIVFYIFVCMKLPNSVQLASATVLSAVYTVVMIVVTVGTILNIVSEDILSPTVLFLACLSAIFALAGLWHPREIGCLFHGILYYVAVPSTFIFLTVYFICNIHVVKWGTRENSSATQTNTKQKTSKFDLIVTLLNGAKNKLTGVAEQQSFGKVSDKVDEEAPAQTEEPNNNATEKKRTIADWTYQDPFFKYIHDAKTPKHEDRFWKKVLRKYLEPIVEDNQHELKIKNDLMKLRNNIVFAFFMTNFLFSVALLQLQMNREKLTSFYLFGKYEPVSIIFLSIFTLLLVSQFFSMLIHRWSTFQHLISSTRLVTCSDLSESEKFRINYKTVKQSVDEEPPPDYDMQETMEDNMSNVDSESRRRHDGARKKKKSDTKHSNVYKKRVNKNIGRTVQRQCSREHQTNFQLPTFGRSKYRYMSGLYNDYHHAYNNPV